MTDLRDQIAAQLDLDTWCGTSPERIAEIVRPVIAAHEAEVVGRILDHIDALHPRIANPVPNSITVHLCGADRYFFPCPTRRLTAEIRGEMRLSQGAAAIRGEQQ